MNNTADNESRHERWMDRALQLAQLGAQRDEVPVGALVVMDGLEVGSGFNQPISAVDGTAHAEIVALRAAFKHVDNYRLPESTMYVTIEPCLMCLGAMVHARIGTIVFGALEPKAGALISHPIAVSDWLNHRPAVVAGVRASRCAHMMTDFFKRRRCEQNKTEPNVE